VRHRRLRPQDGAPLHAVARNLARDAAEGHSRGRSLVPHLRGAGVRSAARAARAPGAIASVALGLLLLAFAATFDLPRETQSFKGDEATYYSLTKSLATDFDFSFERKDLTRVWEEFRSGPEGIFLKRGKVNRIRSSNTFPYVRRVK